jgi:hypothetical protein
LLAAGLAFGLVAVACSSSDSDAEATAAPLASPDDLESFRFELIAEITGAGDLLGDDSAGASGLSVDFDATLEASGAVVAPDRTQAQIKADLGFISLDIESITIGDRSWSREPGADWVEAGAGNGVSDLGFDLAPTDLFGSTDDADLADLRDILAERAGSREDVNGVDAVRYELTLDDIREQIESNPDLGSVTDLEGLGDLTLAMWLERESGIPVRLLLEATGSPEDGSGEAVIRLEMNLTDLNSDSIEIEAP